jgi:poly(hydroxyalkanoate) granule-associated protein
MEKKLKAMANEDDEKLADAVFASAQQIWQAGLGAFAIAEQEGGKVFSKLVKEGANMQRRTRKLAEIKVSGVTDSMTKMAGNVSKQASGSWDKIEQVFEDRVSRTLASLGVPTSKDIHDLTKRVEELAQTITTLSTKKLISGKGSEEIENKVHAVAKAIPKISAKKISTNPTARAGRAVKPAINPTTKKKTLKPRLENVKLKSGES